MGKLKYSVAETERLITTVRKFTAIYDCSDPSHKDLVYIENSWKAISNKLGLPDDQGMCKLPFLINIIKYMV